MEEVVPKMAYRRGSNAGLSEELYPADDVHRCYRRIFLSVLSCIGKRRL